jgi:hypothetical protein
MGLAFATPLLPQLLASAPRLSTFRQESGAVVWSRVMLVW